MSDNIYRYFDNSSDLYFKNSRFVKALFMNKHISSFENYYEIIKNELIETFVKYFEFEAQLNLEIEHKKARFDKKEIKTVVDFMDFKEELKMFYTHTYALIDIFNFQNFTNLPNNSFSYYYLSPDIICNIHKYIIVDESLRAFINLISLFNKVSISEFNILATVFNIPTTVNGSGESSLNVSTKSTKILAEHREWVSKYNINKVMYNLNVRFLVLYEEKAYPHAIYKCILIPNYTKQEPGNYVDLEYLYSLLN